MMSLDFAVKATGTHSPKSRCPQAPSDDVRIQPPPPCLFPNPSMDRPSSLSIMTKEMKLVDMVTTGNFSGPKLSNLKMPFAPYHSTYTTSARMVTSALARLTYLRPSDLRVLRASFLYPCCPIFPADFPTSEPAASSVLKQVSANRSRLGQ